MIINLVTVGIAYICFRKLFQCTETSVFRKKASTGTISFAFGKSCVFGFFNRGRAAGVIAAILYTCFPYRIYVMYGKADSGELLAIAFLPMVFCGILRIILLEDSQNDRERKLWIMPTLGFCTIFFSCVTAFELAVFLSVLLCLLSGKRVFSKKRLLTYGKIALATVVGCAWLIVPLTMTFFQRSYILSADSESIQQKGAYLLSYFIMFWQSGTSQNSADNGIKGSVPVSAGFTTIILLFVFFWIVFTGRYKEERKSSLLWKMAGRVVAVGIIFMMMSTVSFPWDMIQRNRVISFLTAGLQSPMELVPCVTVCLVFVGCMVLTQVMESERKEIVLWAFTIVAVLVLITTQYLINNYQESGQSVHALESTELSANQILSEAYLYVNEKKEGSEDVETLIQFLHNDDWSGYILISMMVSAVGWSMTGIYLMVTGIKRKRENRYVEKIRSDKNC